MLQLGQESRGSNLVESFKSKCETSQQGLGKLEWADSHSLTPKFSLDSCLFRLISLQGQSAPAKLKEGNLGYVAVKDMLSELGQKDHYPQSTES